MFRCFYIINNIKLCLDLITLTFILKIMMSILTLKWPERPGTKQVAIAESFFDWNIFLEERKKMKCY